MALSSRWIVLIGLLYTGTGSWAQQWTESLTVTLGETVRLLQFGLHPNATDGIDADLGEEELPPPPPRGTAVWTGPGFGHGLALDLRQSTPAQVMLRLRIDRGDQTGDPVISWNQARMAALTSSAILADPLGGDAVQVDMRSTGRFRLANRFINELELRFTNQPPPPAPTVLSISPAQGTTGGGSRVALAGTGFIGVTGVTIGGNACAQITVTGTAQLSCTTPPGAAGTADVAVVTPGGTARLAAGFTYVSPPDIIGVTPGQGPEDGGTVVTVTGVNFSALTGVTMGGNPCEPVAVESPEQLTCTTPAGNGTVDVVLINAGGSDTLADGYSYLPPAPVVSSVAPSTGPLAGGTAVRVKGANFTGVTGVRIGGNSCIDVRVTSPEELACVTPAGVAGAADVAVTAAGGTGTLVNGFTYQAAPLVTRVMPRQGPEAGGTAVTVEGSHFTGVTGVRIGGNPCAAVTMVSPSALVCVAPGGTAGAADVTVTSAGGTGALPGGFLYIGVPLITRIAPDQGPQGGGTEATVEGVNFVSVQWVNIGERTCARFTVNSATQITCTTPTGPAGRADVEVINEAGSGVLTAGFTYIGPPAIARVVPDRGPAAGGTVVTFTGANFIGVTGVTIGGNACGRITVDSAAQITCTTPAGAVGPQTGVVTAIGGSGALANAFTFLRAPVPTHAQDRETPGVTYALEQNYPNPFNPTTTIAYRLQQAGPVRLNIYNVAGRRVQVLVDRFQAAGSYTVVWDGRDQARLPVSNGVYFYALKAGPFRSWRKMLLMR